MSDDSQVSQPCGVRIPLDLAIELDRRCVTAGTKRSRVIIAALRAYLKLPDPAESARNAKETAC